MTCKLVYATEKSFTNDKQELVEGWQLGFLNEETGEYTRHFVNKNDLKGFDVRQLSTIKGKELEISTTAKTYQGKTRIVLDKIVELV